MVAARRDGGAGTGQLFSFFVTSLAAMQQLSGNTNGFGGDLRYGMTSGLDGADKICQTIASNEGFGNKTWRAFLSVTAGPVNAIDRVGAGPWYDRLGRLVATGVSGLIAGDRPDGLATVVADLPNEKGVQEHLANTSYDDHDTLDREQHARPALQHHARQHLQRLDQCRGQYRKTDGRTPLAGRAFAELDPGAYHERMRARHLPQQLQL